MHIGGNLLGGYLYLNLSNEDFGTVLYLENYTMKETFPSFDDLLPILFATDNFAYHSTFCRRR